LKCEGFQYHKIEDNIKDVKGFVSLKTISKFLWMFFEYTWNSDVD